MSEVSALERARVDYEPHLPRVFLTDSRGLTIEDGAPTGALRDGEAIRECFPRTFGRPAVSLTDRGRETPRGPLRVGVVLSGGQAPGGHNVITGLFDALQKLHGDSRLYGFLGGPRGIHDGRHRELTAPFLQPFRNTGGFDMIGAGRDKIETDEQLGACARVCTELALDGLVIVGGDDSNTNCAVLAEYFLAHDIHTSAVGVPKTIDGDMKGAGVEASFGFDTATKVYAELIGNICRDARSAGKYWHFVKLMGRHASHVTLECALQTRANVALIGEEIAESELSLDQIVEHVAEVVRRRAHGGKSHGVCLVPEGAIEFIPEIRALIGELNRLLHEHAGYFESLSLFSDRQEFVNQKLGREASHVFSCLPVRIQQQLLLERDAHGNVQVSKIDTEALLVEQVRERIAQWSVEGDFPGKFQVQGHFFGYEGRCAAPSNFDADYTYTLGHVAAALIAFRRTGYICSVTGLAGEPVDWRPGGVPLSSLMRIETRKGRPAAVIGKALVRTDGGPFRALAAHREQWENEDCYTYPGAIQYFGPRELSGRPTRTLELEHRDR